MSLLDSFSPVDGSLVGQVETADAAAVAAAIGRAQAAFLAWRLVPPPRRGELVRLLGEVLREEKDGARPAGQPGMRQDPLRRASARSRR